MIMAADTSVPASPASFVSVMLGEAIIAEVSAALGAVS
jgi:hypothetical protein